jgi:putative ABC transport system permease protein
VLASYNGLVWRNLRTRRLRAVLTAFGIVLGVGMVFGVLSLTGTIRATFDDLISSAWGSKDLIVSPESGGGRFAPSTLTRIRATPGVRVASGMVGAQFVRLDAHGRAETGPGGRMWVAGYDTSQPAPYDFHWVAGHAPRAGTAIGVERNWAHDHGVSVGQRLRVGTPIGPRTIRVVGMFRFSDNLSFGGQGLAGMPIAGARTLMSIPSGWQQITVEANDRGDIAALQRRLTATLGPGARVQTPQGVANDVGSSLQALNIVLYFFSGVALFVGGFLILNSFNMTILQRTRELGLLRTLGASRRMITRSILLEALALGVLGSALGLALGFALVFGLVALMRGFSIPVGHVQISGTAAIIAVATGLLATAVGAWLPARRAGRIAPIRAVLGGRETQHSRRGPRAVAALILFVPGAILGGSLWFANNGNGSALRGLIAITLTMAMFIGMVLAAPVIIPPLVELIGRPLRRLSPTAGRMATDATRSNVSRTAATAIALTIGLSVVVVNAGMTSSFLGTLRAQIDQGYARDVNVQPQGAAIEQGGAQTIAPAVGRELAALPQAAVVSPLRVAGLRMPRLGDTLGLVEGVQPRTFGIVDHGAIAGASRDAALAGVARGGVIVARGYAHAAGLHVGDRLTLHGASGTRTARVAGVLNTMTAMNGMVIQVSLATMRDVYGVTADAQLLVQARSPAQRAALTAAVQRLLRRDHPELEALSNADVKQQITDEVNRQFGLFNAILLIAIIVSLLGVVNTLAMSAAERTREIGLLRALGASRWLVRASMLDESLLITCSGALAGIALGTLIAWSWVQGLGSLLPGIAFRFPTSQVVGVAVAAIVLGVIAAALPARRAARLDVLDALAYE